MTTSPDGTARRNDSEDELVSGPAPCEAVRKRATPIAAGNEERLLAAVAAVPRRLFLPEGVEGGITAPPVDVTLMMLRALDLTGTERVLEIGCGSGYETALLARLAREVVSLEIEEARAKRAAEILAQLGCANVRVIHADGSAGFARLAPYQAIVVDAAVTEVPLALLAQLDQGGRLVIALGEGEAQIVERMEKRGDSLRCTTIGLAHLKPLVTTRRRPSPYPWNQTKYHGT